MQLRLDPVINGNPSGRYYAHYPDGSRYHVHFSIARDGSVWAWSDEAEAAESMTVDHGVKVRIWDDETETPEYPRKVGQLHLYRGEIVDRIVTEDDGDIRLYIVRKGRTHWIRASIVGRPAGPAYVQLGVRGFFGHFQLCPARPA